MDSLINFDYNGTIIPFELTGNDVMINATEMVKLFPGKRIAEWKRLPSTVNYLEAMFDMGFSHFKDGSDLIISSRGSQVSRSRGGGSTWMHRLVAIEFARWLNPKFSIWCNMKIDEIINQGYAFRDAEIQRLNGVIQSMQPQVNYYKDILTYSELSYSTEQICKELNLGCSAHQLLDKLESFGFIYRRPDGKWFLSSSYDSCGYVIVISKVVTSKAGNKYTKLVKRWTELGKYFIWSLKKKLGFN